MTVVVQAERGALYILFLYVALAFVVVLAAIAVSGIVRADIDGAGRTIAIAVAAASGLLAVALGIEAAWSGGGVERWTVTPERVEFARSLFGVKVRERCLAATELRSLGIAQRTMKRRGGSFTLHTFGAVGRSGKLFGWGRFAKSDADRINRLLTARLAEFGYAAVVPSLA